MRRISEVFMTDSRSLRNEEKSKSDVLRFVLGFYGFIYSISDFKIVCMVL